jgi:hypothetical protein
VPHPCSPLLRPRPALCPHAGAWAVSQARALLHAARRLLAHRPRSGGRRRDAVPAAPGGPFGPRHLARRAVARPVLRVGDAAPPTRGRRLSGGAVGEPGRARRGAAAREAHSGAGGVADPWNVHVHGHTACACACACCMCMCTCTCMCMCMCMPMSMSMCMPMSMSMCMCMCVSMSIVCVGSVPCPGGGPRRRYIHSYGGSR